MIEPLLYTGQYMDLEPWRQLWYQPEVRALLVVAFLVFVIGQIPILSWPLYPFFLFEIFVHEVSHALVILLTGGEFHGIKINPLDGSAHFKGGRDFFITIAGYSGTSLLAALLLVIVAQGADPRFLLLAIGVTVLVLDLLMVRNWFGRLAMFLIGMGFILVSWYLHDLWNQAIIWLIIITLFVDTFRALSWLLPMEEYAVSSDAHVLGRTTCLPTLAWILLWMAVGVGALAFALSKIYNLPLPWYS